VRCVEGDDLPHHAAAGLPGELLGKEEAQSRAGLRPPPRGARERRALFHFEDLDRVTPLQYGVADRASRGEERRGSPREAEPGGGQGFPRIGPAGDLDERDDEVAGNEGGVLDENDAPVAPREAGSEPHGDGGLSRAARREGLGTSRGEGAAVPCERARLATRGARKADQRPELHQCLVVVSG